MTIFQRDLLKFYWYDKSDVEEYRPVNAGISTDYVFTYVAKYIYMSHFAYMCKMRYPLNLVLESCKYLWFYWTFCIVILDYG